MKYILTILLPLIFAFQSCIEPVNIELARINNWVAFGIIGEEQPPVIFIYGSNLIEEKIQYNYNAIIKIENLNTGSIDYLAPVINNRAKYFETNEFPFSNDNTGKYLFYSSSSFKAMPGNDYRVTIEIENEQATTLLSLPPVANFESVDLVEMDNGRTKVQMAIDDQEGINYYKWDIVINAMFDFPTINVDTITGDSIEIINEIAIEENYTPRNYIKEEDILENENEFNFNVSNNINEFPQIDESYQLNIRLRNYGQELVNYFESIEAQNQIFSFDPFVEPIFIASNIDGMLGMIGTFSYSPTILLEYQP